MFVHISQVHGWRSFWDLFRQLSTALGTDYGDKDAAKQSQSLRWGQLEDIQQLGQDACLLLTLAARHLTVMHVVVAATKERHMEEWIYPLNRRRSTTEEEATGPLIDESELEDYFSAASARWYIETNGGL